MNEKHIQQVLAYREDKRRKSMRRLVRRHSNCPLLAEQEAQALIEKARAEA